MINIRNILKVLLVALFVCAYSGDVRAQVGMVEITAQNAKQYGYDPDNLPPPGTMYNTITKTSVQPSTTSSNANSSAAEQVTTSGNSQQNATFCSADLGIFTELVQTGRTIFNRLRDLIYVVAGFGIIAVAVGGFFGNLNWKWLGAIIISLVVMATAGEIIVLITGCDKFDDSLITNTLAEPTDTLDASYDVGEGGSKTVREYNEYYVGQEPAEGTEGNTEGEEPVSEGEPPAE